MVLVHFHRMTGQIGEQNGQEGTATSLSDSMQKLNV